MCNIHVPQTAQLTAARQRHVLAEYMHRLALSIRCFHTPQLMLLLLLLQVTSRVHTRKEPANGSWGYRNKTETSHPVPPDWPLAKQQDQLLKAHPTRPQYQTRKDQTPETHPKKDCTVTTNTCAQILAHKLLHMGTRRRNSNIQIGRTSTELKQGSKASAHCMVEGTLKNHLNLITNTA